MFDLQMKLGSDIMAVNLSKRDNSPSPLGVIKFSSSYLSVLTFDV